jgi:hypothetical protein
MTKKIEGFAEVEESEDGKIKLVFEPGCFDEFDGTQEELDEAIAEITKMFENGLAEAESREVDLEELMETDPEVAEKVFNALQRIDGNENEPPTRTLQ